MATYMNSVGFTSYNKLSNIVNIKQGGYGIVSRATHEDWGLVAYKELLVKFINDREGNLLVRETAIQGQLCHENILKVFGFVFESGHYGLVLEFMEHGELIEYLQANKCDMELKLQMIRDVASGMNYLHSRTPPVIHGDLKIENVLVGSDLKAKISDFGFSHWREFSQSKSKHEVRLGTVTHIPPENWKDPNLRKMETFDVYGFAILVWEALTEKRPFNSISRDMISVFVLKGHRPDVKLIPGDVSKNIIKLMKCCWSQCPRDRPKFKDIQSYLEQKAKKCKTHPGVKKKFLRLLNKNQTKKIVESQNIRYVPGSKHDTLETSHEDSKEEQDYDYIEIQGMSLNEPGDSILPHTPAPLPLPPRSHTEPSFTRSRTISEVSDEDPYETFESTVSENESESSSSESIYSEPDKHTLAKMSANNQSGKLKIPKEDSTKKRISPIRSLHIIFDESPNLDDTEEDYEELQEPTEASKDKTNYQHMLLQGSNSVPRTYRRGWIKFDL